MNLDAIDWNSLERLRAAFLSGTAGAGDYWQGESDLASYDATFAQRIGWKWDYVLAELERRGWSPPHGELLDWGCGSGIAGRAVLDFFGMRSVSGLRVLDRSAVAMQFAMERARAKYPGLEVNTGLGSFPATQSHHPDPLPRGEGRGEGELGSYTILISHVLTELTPEQTSALADFAAKATAVIWVEPGTYEASLTLIAIRERLREKLNLVAACTHQ